MGQKLFRNILAILLLAIVAIPSLVSAQEPVTEISAIKAFDTVAGQNTVVLLHGTPNEVVTIKQIDPLKHSIQYRAQLGSNGSLVYTIEKPTIAGKYFVLADKKGASFTVSPAEPRVNIETSDTIFRLNELLTATVNIRDDYKNPVSGLHISAISKEKSVLTCKPSNCESDSRGKLEVTVRFTKQGFQTLRFSNAQTGQTYETREFGVLPASNTSQNPSLFRSANPLAQPFVTEEGDYLRIYNDSELPLLNGSGNSDSGLSDLDLNSFLMAQLGTPLVETSTTSPPTTTQATLPTVQEVTTTTTAQVSTTAQSATTTLPATTAATATTIPAQTHAPRPAGEPDRFEIEFEESPIIAGLVPVFTIRILDVDNEIVPDYAGTVLFDITPAGPVLPGDYTFLPNEDQGEKTFDISLLIQRPGTYIFTVEDQDDPTTRGEKEIIVVEQEGASQSSGGPSLTLVSPIAGSTYSGALSVSGSVDKTDTEVSVKNGDTLVGKTTVDQDRRFDLPITLQVSGPVTLTIEAKHIPSNTVTTTQLAIIIDKTPPVIISVSINPETVKAGESVTIVLLSEPNITAKVLINNVPHEFPVSTNNSYTVTASSPTVAGTYPLTIEVTDEYNNSETVPSVAVLTVKPPIENLIGIPGVESITLQWDSVPASAGYQITYFLSGLQQTLTSQTNSLLVENLSAAFTYTFQVLALGADGKNVSSPAETIALRPLEPQVVPETPVLSDYTAADLHQAPPINTSSGPEVYVFIALSIILLDLYSRARKSFQ